MIRGLATLALLTATVAASAADAAPGDDALFEKLLGGDAEAGPAADPAPPEPDSVGEPGPEEVLAGQEGTVRVARALAEAERLLEARETGEDARAAQREAIEELQRLIESAKAAPRPSQSGADGADRPGEAQSDGPMRSGEAGGDGSAQAGARPGGPGVRNKEGKAEESSERLRGESAESVVREFRSDLARDAWGHLPERLRERLFNAERDQNVPQYDELVRRYFESLAQPGAEESE